MKLLPYSSVPVNEWTSQIDRSNDMYESVFHTRPFDHGMPTADFNFYMVKLMNHHVNRISKIRDTSDNEWIEIPGYGFHKK